MRKFKAIFRSFSENEVHSDRTTSGAVDVIFISAEDTAGMLVPGLMAAGADLTRIHILEGYCVEGDIGEDGKEKVHPLSNLTTELGVLAAAIEQWPETKLVIIDPILDFTGGLNENNKTEMEAYLQSITKLAREKHVAIIGTHQSDKTEPADFLTIPRTIWRIAKDPQDNDRRLFIPVKTDLCKQPKELAFRLVEVDTPRGSAVKCEFETERD